MESTLLLQSFDHLGEVVNCSSGGLGTKRLGFCTFGGLFGTWSWGLRSRHLTLSFAASKQVWLAHDKIGRLVEGDVPRLGLKSGALIILLQ